MESNWPSTLPHRVDEIMHQHCERIAVQDGFGNMLTYKQMAFQINAITSALLSIGIQPDSRIAIFQEPTVSWVCSILAIMRAGAACVPLDILHPIARLRNIVQDCQPSAILAHNQTMTSVSALLTQQPDRILNITTIVNSRIAGDSKHVPNKANPESAAVILYTSGSTGAPKGVILKHSCLRNEIEGYSKEWVIGVQKVLQQSSFSFDFSLDQIFTALSNGGCVYIVPKDLRADPIAITKIIQSEAITYTKATPTEYSMWLRYGGSNLAHNKTWKLAFGGGEPFTDMLAKAFQSLQIPQLRLFNSYGPAEATVSSTKIEISYAPKKQDHDIPIPAGLTLPNYSVRIVDKSGEVVPIGVPGEIVIAGAGISMGYLNDEESTKRKFVPDKYATKEYISNGWLTAYRTGDQGRLRDDGALLFDGRIDGDTQIKLRGIRIELGDVESVILSTARGALADAVVSVRGDPQFLVAHVVFAAQQQSQLKTDHGSFLTQLLSDLPLPQYMRPAMLIPLEKMPLNGHFKVDRMAIYAMPLPRNENPNSVPSAGLSEAETQLKRVWISTISKEVANYFTIESNTDFFQVGGNSLLLIQLQGLIRKTFNIDISLVSLFESSTIYGMASLIQRSPSTVPIDWEEETSLPFHDEGLQIKSRPTVTSGMVVLLTGATGYLGGRILAQLVAEKSVSKIHCVAVRKHTEREPRKLSVESEKIETHIGNLTSPLLGLSQELFASLAGEVDVIIHSGADRSFWENYPWLRKQNVDSTKGLVILASPNRIPIHFLSSGGVLEFAPPEHGATSMASFLPPTNGSNGYNASKWASEVVLEKASEKLGLPIYIHRTIPGTNDTADIIPESLLAEFSTMATLLDSLPASDGWTGHFDLMSVEAVGHAILKEAIGVSPQADLLFNLRHHQSSFRVSTQKLSAYLEDKYGKQILERIPAPKWVGKAKGVGFNYLISSQNVVLDTGGIGLNKNLFVSKR
jgi:hybrid polyketide synthase/nonribosomal peptide synthetase ACE1